MALLWLDGCDVYEADADLQRHYTVNATAAVAQAPAGGRFGGGAIQCSLVVGNDGTITRAVSPAGATLIAGFAFRLVPIADTGADGIDEILVFADAGAVTHVTVAIDTATRLLKAYRGTTAGTLLATGTVPLALDTWHQMECKVTVDDASGRVEIRLNGSPSPDLLFTGDTRNAGSAGIAAVSWNAVAVSSTKLWDVHLDDLYLLDTSGAANNDFLGDMRVYTLRPNADTAQKDFSRSAGADSYALVDDPLSDDGDATYVESATVGHRDLYELEGLPVGASGLKAVQLRSVARKDDAGARSARALLRSGATTAAGATQALGTGYAETLDRWETDPATGAAWTAGAVNALQAGYEVVA